MESKKTFAQKLSTEKAAGYICSVPFVIGFLGFMLIPMVISLYYAFCDYDIVSPPVFSGLKNLKKAFSEPRFWMSLRATAYFALIGTPLKVIFALIVALILLRNSKVSGIYRAVYYMPSIIGGSVAVAFLWKRMFQPDGTINRVIRSVFPEYKLINWLADERAIWVLILLTVWQFGSSMLIFLSSLKQINQELYEAAEVDGANKWKQFWKVTLPLLTPTVFFNLLQQTINSLLAFTQSWVITGGTQDTTRFYAVYQYQEAFTNRNAGYASCLAWIMLVLVSIVTFLLFKSRSKWVYDA